MQKVIAALVGPVLFLGFAIASERHRVASLREQAQLNEWFKDASRRKTQQQPIVCPCEQQELCQPIKGPPIRPSGELFAFSDSSSIDTSYYNWTYLSTIAWASDQVMCQAHAHGVRAVLATPTIDLKALVQPQARHDWVQNVLFLVQGRFMDGVTFDYELPMEADSVDSAIYVQLVNETKQAFVAANPSLQVTVCVGWSPDGIDGRYYPAAELAQVSDALYVMDYDTQSQIISGPCIAAANAPYFGMVHGLTSYLNLGIEPTKLILGVPWYGYRYPCVLNDLLLNPLLAGGAGKLSSSLTVDRVVQVMRFCPIKSVPFRGVSCSDAAGTEIAALTIWKRQQMAFSNVQRDVTQDAVYFNAIEDLIEEHRLPSWGNTTVVQYWYDDPSGLRRKFAKAREMRLGGIGPYAINDMNPELFPGDKELQYARAYWSAFDEYFAKQATLRLDSHSNKRVARK